VHDNLGSLTVFEYPEIRQMQVGMVRRLAVQEGSERILHQQTAFQIDLADYQRIAGMIPLGILRRDVTEPVQPAGGMTKELAVTGGGKERRAVRPRLGQKRLQK
jgi:hypothetical protein